MLFVLDQSLRSVLEQGTVQSPSRDALDYLAGAVWEGKHRLTGQVDLLRSLMRLRQLPTRTRVVLEDAVRTIADDMQLRGVLPVIAIVTASSLPRPTSVLIGDQRQIEIPLLWLNDSCRVQATWLLAENLTDAVLIEFIATTVRGISAYEGKSRPPARLRCYPGGGNVTADVLQHLHEAEEFCVCIVDSDRGCPGDSCGNTAARVQRFKQMDQYPLIAVKETLGRELENDLPNDFYRRKYSEDPNHQRSVNALANLSAAGEHEARAHLDIKEGMSLADLFRLDVESPARMFWNQKVTAVAQAAGIDATRLRCHGSDRCGAPLNCECRITNGHSDDLLDAFITTFKNCSPREISRMIDGQVRASWFALADLVVAWCCAKDRVRS